MELELVNFRNAKHRGRLPQLLQNRKVHAENVRIHASSTVSAAVLLAILRSNGCTAQLDRFRADFKFTKLRAFYSQKATVRDSVHCDLHRTLHSLFHCLIAICVCV